jgi:hypothetical protein
MCAWSRVRWYVNANTLYTRPLLVPFLVVSQAEFVLNQVVEAMPGAEGSIMCGGNIRGYQNYTCNQVRTLD